MTQPTIKSALKLISAVIITFGLSLALQSAIGAWQNPTCPPPGCNVPTPINVGVSTAPAGQIMYDGLEISDGTVIGTSSGLWVSNFFIVNGSDLYVRGSEPRNVGIGTMNPNYKLDVQGGQVNASGGLCIAGSCKTAWSEVQTPLTGSCPAGQAIRSISQTGAVTCETTYPGTVTSVGSGWGLSGGPITTSGSLSVNNTQIQQRVTGTCGAGYAVGSIGQNGTVSCNVAGGANADTLDGLDSSSFLRKDTNNGLNSGVRIAFNGNPITSGYSYGIGNGAAYNNLNSIAVDTLETDGGTGGSGTLELNYYGGNEVHIGPGGSKPLRTSMLYDGYTGYYMDPSATSRLNYLLLDNTYTYGNENVYDIYIRAAGKWASAMASSLDYVRNLSQPVLFKRFIGSTVTYPYYDAFAPATMDQNVWHDINLSAYGPPGNAKFAVIKFYAASGSSRNIWMYWRKSGDQAPYSPVVNAFSPNNSDDSAADTNTVWVPYSTGNPVMQVWWGTSNGGAAIAIRAILEGWITQ